MCCSATATSSMDNCLFQKSHQQSTTTVPLSPITTVNLPSISVFSLRATKTKEINHRFNFCKRFFEFFVSTCNQDITQNPTLNSFIITPKPSSFAQVGPSRCWCWWRGRRTTAWSCSSKGCLRWLQLFDQNNQQSERQGQAKIEYWLIMLQLGMLKCHSQYILVT